MSLWPGRPYPLGHLRHRSRGRLRRARPRARGHLRHDRRRERHDRGARPLREEPDRMPRRQPRQPPARPEAEGHRARARGHRRAPSPRRAPPLGGPRRSPLLPPPGRRCRGGPDQRFLFRWPDGRLAATAESFAGFRQAVASIDDLVLADHARRRDLSRWVLDVFADKTLGVQLRKLEARSERGEVPDLRQELERLIAFRYDMEP